MTRLLLLTVWLLAPTAKAQAELCIHADTSIVCYECCNTRYGGRRATLEPCDNQCTQKFSKKKKPKGYNVKCERIGGNGYYRCVNDEVICYNYG